MKQLLLHFCMHSYDKTVKILRFVFLQGTSLADFRTYIMEDISTKEKILQLKKAVETFAKEFPLPGFDKT